MVLAQSSKAIEAKALLHFGLCRFHDSRQRLPHQLGLPLRSVRLISSWPHEARDARINRWVVPYNSAKVDLRRLSCRTRPRRIDNTTGQLPNFKYESERYHKLPLAYPQEMHEEDCWSEVTSTKEKPNGAWRISPLGA